jgi:hypothetical protein
LVEKKIKKSTKITKILTSLDKSQSRPRSTGFADGHQD